ncbi:MAG: hypothetical protein M1598_04375 [Actinobacteria bacterium]|nr:hypothetical protein [Actinomycetota bacterium]
MRLFIVHTRRLALRGVVGFLAFALTSTWPASWFSKSPASGEPAYPVDRGMIEAEYGWLTSSQRPDGALAQNPQKNAVVPYFANLSAMVLVGENPGLVREYLTWYLGHLNRPDRWGLDGTIYDYTYYGGTEENTERYDSADSYAATFLSLVAAYHRATGDLEFVKANREKLQAVADVIAGLQDTDGLVWATPGKETKYLMDNAEDYRGLSDWAELLAALGDQKSARVYARRAASIKSGITVRMWSPWRKQYAWSIDAPGNRAWVRAGVWYPDAVSQLYPLLFGVVPADGPDARAAWRRFTEAFPRWYELEREDPFPWAIVAYAAVRVGEKDSARAYVEHMRKRKDSAPWYGAESAFFIMTLEELGKPK